MEKNSSCEDAPNMPANMAVADIDAEIKMEGATASKSNEQRDSKDSCAEMPKTASKQPISNVAGFREKDSASAQSCPCSTFASIICVGLTVASLLGLGVVYWIVSSIMNWAILSPPPPPVYARPGFQGSSILFTLGALGAAYLAFRNQAQCRPSEVAKKAKKQVKKSTDMALKSAGKVADTAKELAKEANKTATNAASIMKTTLPKPKKPAAPNKLAVEEPKKATSKKIVHKKGKTPARAISKDIDEINVKVKLNEETKKKK